MTQYGEWQRTPFWLRVLGFADYRRAEYAPWNIGGGIDRWEFADAPPVAETKPSPSSTPATASETDWQDIETAPRDGTWILANTAGTHPHTHAPFVPDVIQWLGGRWDNGFDRSVYRPTHWMPLPAPPKPAGEA